MQLRPYQNEAVRAVLQEWSTGTQKTLLVLPTGTGKTVVFSTVIRSMVADGHRVLVLAHRGELLDQATAKIKAIAGVEVEREQGTSHAGGAPVIVASVQTLSREKRLAGFNPEEFGAIVIDEAHHSLSDSYKTVINYFTGARLLGVTATPDRGDLKSLGEIYESLAYEYDLRTAIKDGYLAPIKAMTIPLEMNLKGVKTSQGDYNAGDLGHALEPYLAKIADEMATVCQGRKTVVFLPLIETAQRFTALLNARGLSAAEVNGQSLNRGEILADFETGRYNVLCNSMLLTEGWDCPAVDCVVVLRPTKVRSLYSQMVGRGTRLSPGKDHLLLLDFLWQTEKHNLCHPASLICSDAEIAARMVENAKDGKPADITDAEMVAERDVMAERERALAKELERQFGKKRKTVDPIGYGFSIEDRELSHYVPTFAWQAQPATEKQLEFLERKGINTRRVNAGRAKLLINKIIERDKAGMSSPKQIVQLENRGFKHVGAWTRDEATAVISAIAATGWKRTPRQYWPPAEYKPARLANQEAE